MKRTRRLGRTGWLALTLCAAAAQVTLGCSAGDGGAGTPGSGGTPAATGGSSATGGHPSGSGGSVSSSTGGAPAAGGAPPTGGTGGSLTGGAGRGGPATGGGPGTGGSAAGGTGGGTGGSTGGSGGDGGRSGTGGGGGSGGAPPGTAYAPCPATGTCAIMPLGDSITEGYRSSKGGGYRVELFHDALADKKSVTFVGSAPPNGPPTVDGVAFPPDNEGHGGYRISQISNLVVASMMTNKPNIVLLMIGTNDVGTSTTPIGTSGAQNIANQLGSLIDQITGQDPKVLVVVAQIVPHITDAVDANIQAYNALIPGVVKARADAGRHVLLVDMHAAFLARANWKTTLLNQSDKQHPTDAGYVIMGDTWYPAIKPFLH
ncbi:MAG TPA: SGNH/GDSL hydrolase family protein [Polyangia bacterium]|nr:SGNH/GDSL hydrolase family protein [Polyangia bacterium]